MKAPVLLAALLGAAAVSVSAFPASAVQAQRDWSQMVAVTPEGGYRMGNPDAPVKLIEFVSLTCGHCAHFSAEGMPPLVENYVKTGRVSFELRNHFLNGIDLVAAIVSRCAAPGDYFKLTDHFLGDQRQWVGRIQALTEEQRGEIGKLGPVEGLQRLATLAGFEAIAARHGIEPGDLRACLADEARAQKLIDMRHAAERDFNVTSTPSFLVNGRLVEGVHDWAALEPLIKQAT